MEQRIQPLTPERRHRIGMRIIKTVIAVFLCGLLAFLRDKSALYSVFAAAHRPFTLLSAVAAPHPHH